MGIWGKEVEEIQAKSVEVVKQKHPPSGYDKMQITADIARKNELKRQAKT